MVKMEKIKTDIKFPLHTHKHRAKKDKIAVDLSLSEESQSTASTECLIHGRLLPSEQSLI